MWGLAVHRSKANKQVRLVKRKVSLFQQLAPGDDATPKHVAYHHAFLSVEFSRQKHWIGLPYPPPGDLPDPGTEPASPALAGRFFTSVPLGKPVSFLYILNYFKFSIKYHFNLF